MTKKVVFRKSLVIGIIMLFLGASVVPNITAVEKIVNNENIETELVSFNNGGGPTADFSYNNNGLKYTFQCLSQASAGRFIAERTWFFGDGSSPGSGAVVTHTYDLDPPADVEVSLLVEDNEGDTDTETKLIHIKKKSVVSEKIESNSVAVVTEVPQTSILGNEPIADFNYTYDDDLWYYFEDLSYDPDGGSITDREWDMGDGTIIIDHPNPSYNYEHKIGETVYVTLTVRDDEGEYGYICKNFTIEKSKTTSSYNNNEIDLVLHSVQKMPDCPVPGKEFTISYKVANDVGEYTESTFKFLFRVEEWDWLDVEYPDFDTQKTHEYSFTWPAGETDPVLVKLQIRPEPYDDWIDLNWYNNTKVFVVAPKKDINEVNQNIFGSPPVANFKYTQNDDFWYYFECISYDPDGGEIEFREWDMYDGVIIEDLQNHSYNFELMKGEKVYVLLTVQDDEEEFDYVFKEIVIKNNKVKNEIIEKPFAYFLQNFLTGHPNLFPILQRFLRL